MIRKIWINCSEASGDMCAGALAGELLRQCPALEIGGLGGPMLARAGATVHFSMDRICFSGFCDVLLGLPKIFRLQREIIARWECDPPDVIVMVDCPDFNLPLAKAAHGMGIPVYYFMAPQLWAWRQRGLDILREHVRTVICGLPFEPEYFRDRGCRAEYAGHPLHDIIPLEALDAQRPRHDRIGFMPGSRRKEIAFLLPVFSHVAAMIHREHPDMTFAIARAPGIDGGFLRACWAGGPAVRIVEPEGRFRMIRTSGLVLAASGTATLETALIGTPTIVCYKLDRPAAFLLRRLALSRFISLTNILSQQEIFPEYLQEQATAENLYRHVAAWLHTPGLLQELRDRLREVRRIAGPAGGMRAAASTILTH
jgi:lipid-A-disaccharide synthase